MGGSGHSLVRGRKTVGGMLARRLIRRCLLASLSFWVRFRFRFACRPVDVLESGTEVTREPLFGAGDGRGEGVGLEPGELKGERAS